MRLIPAKIWEKFAEPYNFPNVLTYDCHNYLSGDWKCSICSLAWLSLFLPKTDRRSLTSRYWATMDSVIVWVIMYGQFIMIGKTFDGKVAIAIVSKENEGDSELTPLQAART